MRGSLPARGDERNEPTEPKEIDNRRPGIAILVVPALQPRRAGYLEDRRTPPMFALREPRKDLGLALALFDESDAPTPLTRASSHLVTAAAMATPDLDISAVVRPYRLAARAANAHSPTASPLAPGAR